MDKKNKSSVGYLTVGLLLLPLLILAKLLDFDLEAEIALLMMVLGLGSTLFYFAKDRGDRRDLDAMLVGVNVLFIVIALALDLFSGGSERSGDDCIIDRMGRLHCR